MNGLGGVDGGGLGCRVRVIGPDFGEDGLMLIVPDEACLYFLVAEARDLLTLLLGFDLSILGLYRIAITLSIGIFAESSGPDPHSFHYHLFSKQGRILFDLLSSNLCNSQNYNRNCV